MVFLCKSVVLMCALQGCNFLGGRYPGLSLKILCLVTHFFSWLSMVLPRFSAPLSMSGADRVGSMSKRSCRRHETRLQQLSHALLALVAIAKLAGPPMSKNSLSSEEFALLIKNSRKRSRVSRLRVLMSARTYTVKSFFNVPGWAKALYYETSQATLCRFR